jgi:hypothetical protein
MNNQKYFYHDTFYLLAYPRPCRTPALAPALGPGAGGGPASPGYVMVPAPKDQRKHSEIQPFRPSGWLWRDSAPLVRHSGQ